MNPIYKTASTACFLFMLGVSSLSCEVYQNERWKGEWLESVGEGLESVMRNKSLLNSKSDYPKINQRLKKEKKLKPLTLEDFAGSFIIVNQSMGGIGGGSGASRAGVGLRTFDKKGVSTFGDIHFLHYTGTPGQVTPLHFTHDSADMTISLTDPEKGLGVIKITWPFGIIEGDIVVQRSEKDGAVLSFYSIAPFINPVSREAEGVALVHYIRQVQ